MLQPIFTLVTGERVPGHLPLFVELVSTPCTLASTLCTWPIQPDTVHCDAAHCTQPIHPSIHCRPCNYCNYHPPTFLQAYWIASHWSGGRAAITTFPHQERAGSAVLLITTYFANWRPSRNPVPPHRPSTGQRPNIPPLFLGPVVWC